METHLMSQYSPFIFRGSVFTCLSPSRVNLLRGVSSDLEAPQLPPQDGHQRQGHSRPGVQHRLQQGRQYRHQRVHGGFPAGWPLGPRLSGTKIFYFPPQPVKCQFNFQPVYFANFQQIILRCFHLKRSSKKSVLVCIKSWKSDNVSLAFHLSVEFTFWVKWLHLQLQGVNKVNN